MTLLRVHIVSAVLLVLASPLYSKSNKILRVQENLAKSGKSKENVISMLFNLTEKQHVQEDHNVIFPPFFWKKKKGVYGSDVKLNFHGDPTLAAMRDSFKVFDNNMFATAWITSCLIEAYEYGKAPKPPDAMISLSLEAVSDFYDRNSPQQPNSIMTFWSQTFNDSSSSWESTPSNLLALFKMTDYFPWSTVEKILTLLGFSQEAKYIKELLDSRASYLKAFQITPDFDDTFLNLGLGSLLCLFNTDFPASHSMWLSQNTNLDSVWSALKKFAYRPFSGDRSVNTIDPRTYFYIRGFLEQARDKAQDVALIPTWVQDLVGNRNMSHKNVAMPFNINNVDATVSANAIFGMTAAVVSGLTNYSVLNDPDIQKIYMNTSAMLVWEIEHDFVGRKDLALTYYPSLIEFFWFVSRTFSLLQRQVQRKQTLLEPLETVRRTFGNVLQGHVTDIILNQTRAEGSEMVYFDDFLGDGDLTAEGEPMVRGEDRIFTTAMAVNTLVNSWSAFDYAQGQISWLKEAPVVVQDVVKKATLWLTENTTSGKYKPWNAFFSGSVKGEDTLPIWYPFNRFEYVNGTKIPLNSTTFSEDVLIGFEGTVSEDEYRVMLNKTRFGRRTPMVFKGYNSDNSSFPFWSSDAYTHATAMLALAQTTALTSSDPEYNVITTV